MKQNELYFYDLPNILGNLGERLASVESKINEIKSNLNVTKESYHVLMSVQEACEYLKMPLSTFYFKVKNDGLPAIKQGKHLLIYRDELDKWLELSRKNPVPLTAEEENEKNLGIVSSQSKTLKLVALWKTEKFQCCLRNWKHASRSLQSAYLTPMKILQRY